MGSGGGILPRRRRNARELKIERAFETAEDLCASPDIDAVFVASPDSLHLNDVLLALKHGKPVLCEKPLAMNAGEVEQMLAAQAKAGVAFGVAQNMRYNASADLMRQWIAEGRIGKPQLASCAVLLCGGQEPAAVDLRSGAGFRRADRRCRDSLRGCSAVSAWRRTGY